MVVHDPDTSQCEQAKEYVRENSQSYPRTADTTPCDLSIKATLPEAVQDAWLVIECVPEKLEAKIQILGQLVKLVRSDAVIATNSSSYRSSEMLAEVPDSSKNRILNMHYYMPPNCMVVELMTDGFTDQTIIDFLEAKCREVGTLPYVARKESTGFIFNRLWAAVKRETLTILAEGVSTPEEIDSMWTEIFLKGGGLPCKAMDSELNQGPGKGDVLTLATAVGLDTVAFIESNYVKERGLSGEKTVDFLENNYLSANKLGNKSANGGLYPPSK